MKNATDLQLVDCRPLGFALVLNIEHHEPRVYGIDVCLKKKSLRAEKPSDLLKEQALKSIKR